MKLLLALSLALCLPPSAGAAGAASRASIAAKAGSALGLPASVVAPPAPALPAVAFSDGVRPLQLNANPAPARFNVRSLAPSLNRAEPLKPAAKPLKSAARPVQALKKSPTLKAARSRETAASQGGLAAAFDGAAFAEEPSAVQAFSRRLAAGLSRAAGSRVEIDRDEGWFTHGRARHRLEYWTLEGRGDPVATRFGPLFFLEEAAYQELPDQLQEDPRLIRLDGLARSGVFSPLAMYSLAGAAILLDMDLRGLIFRDAGAGDGLLSLIAAKRGAARVDLIEYDAASLRRARGHLKLNGLRESTGFRLIQADLTDTPGTAAKLPDPGLPSLLAGSIGNWSADYTAANADVFALIPRLPGLRGLLAAGYASGAPGGGLHHMRWDQELLRLLGWKALPRRGSRGFRMADLWPADRNNYFHLSFAAEPDPAASADPAEFERALARRRSQHRSQLSLEVLRRSRR